MLGGTRQQSSGGPEWSEGGGHRAWDQGNGNEICVLGACECAGVIVGMCALGACECAGVIAGMCVQGACECAGVIAGMETCECSGGVGGVVERWSHGKTLVSAAERGVVMSEVLLSVQQYSGVILAPAVPERRFLGVARPEVSPPAVPEKVGHSLVLGECWAVEGKSLPERGWS